jgi:hypothetical protein
MTWTSLNAVDFFPSRHTRRQQSAGDSQQRRIGYSDEQNSWADLKIYCDVAHRCRVPYRRADPVERKHENAREDSPNEGQQDGLEQKTQHDASLRNPARAVWRSPSAIDRGVHGIQP